MTDLAGKRVLVVEDEAYVALDLRRLLRDHGAVVVGPAPDLIAAEALLQKQEIDAAVLDVNLNGQFSYELAEALSAQGVPLMLLTGYDGWSLPDAARRHPRLAKPFETRAVLEMVTSLCTASRDT